ncbi:wax ester/triacylglycerol synthase domain-containing protein [Streptomyces stramineus]
MGDGAPLRTRRPRGGPSAAARPGAPGPRGPAAVAGPAPRGAPHWRVWLLRGHVPGGYAVLYLVHHAVQDGAGMLHTLETLFTADGVPEDRSSAVFHGFAGAPRLTLPDRVRALATASRTARRTAVWNSSRHPCPPCGRSAGPRCRPGPCGPSPAPGAAPSTTPTSPRSPTRSRGGRARTGRWCTAQRTWS